MIENLKTLKINIMGQSSIIDTGVSLLDLAKDYQKDFKYPIILAKVGNEYKDLRSKVSSNKDISFVDLKDVRGNVVYVNSLVFLLSYAISELFGDNARIEVKHSIDKGLYISTNFDLDKNKCKKIKEKMLDVANKDLEITKCKVDRKEAIEYFTKKKDYSKVDLLKYEVNTYITLYKLGNMYDYFFSAMPTSTSCLTYFDLHHLNERGLVLLFPTVYIDGIKEYEHHAKFFDVFNEYQSWADMLKIGNVPGLNKIVSEGRADDVIRISETIQSNKLLNIAREVYNRKTRVKIILLAGPSSSGKTTTCRKLSTYLRSFGYKPIEISMDDYFVDREKSPLDENGEYDFECLEAVDTVSFERDMKSLIEGKTVRLPRYNFIKGQREPSDNEVNLGNNGILIIEGIHALSDKILTKIDADRKYKIYLSPLTIINVDDHNKISTTDNRLLRRIVRDNRTRGYKVEDTLKIWNKVRLGEEKHIFPNQDLCDVVFNTSFVYELGVLKTYVEPLLYSVDINSPCYDEAIRLINMLKPFLPVPSDAIPDDSILREFIGGSCFK